MLAPQCLSLARARAPISARSRSLSCRQRAVALPSARGRAPISARSRGHQRAVALPSARGRAPISARSRSRTFSSARARAPNSRARTLVLVSARSRSQQRALALSYFVISARSRSRTCHQRALALPTRALALPTRALALSYFLSVRARTPSRSQTRCTAVASARARTLVASARTVVVSARTVVVSARTVVVTARARPRACTLVIYSQRSHRCRDRSRSPSRSHTCQLQPALALPSCARVLVFVTLIAQLSAGAGCWWRIIRVRVRSSPAGSLARARSLSPGFTCARSLGACRRYAHISLSLIFGFLSRLVLQMYVPNM